MLDVVYEAAALTVRELPLRSLMMLRMSDPTDVHIEKASDVLGAALPVMFNTGAGRLTRAIWMGPGEWMIVNSKASAETVEASVDINILCVDLALSRRLLEIKGDAARDFIARGCSLDLHPRVFPIDRTAMTLLAQIPVILDHVTDGAAFHLYHDRCFTDYVDTWVEDTASSMGG